jgi:hypothetical protein
MRLTSKIVLGIILFVFIGAIVFIVGLSFVNIEKVDNFRISQKNVVGVEVPPYKAIVIYQKIHDNITAAIRTDGVVSFKPLTESTQRNKLYMPTELRKYLDIKLQNDTLVIQLDMQKLEKQFTDRKNFNSFGVVEGIDFTIYTDGVDVTNTAYGLAIRMDDLNVESLKVNSAAKVNIVSCNAQSLQFSSDAGGGQLILENSRIQRLNLNLDKIADWQVKDCQIEEENLFGSKTHFVKIPKSETKVLNWHPKNKNARLNIELLEDSARLEFK